MPLRLGLDAPATSGLLFRRRSSLKFCRRSSVNHQEISWPKVPMEILDQIAGLSINSLIENDADTLRANFRTYIGPYTLVSKDFRFLVLRPFFQHLYLRDGVQARSLFDFLSAVNCGYQRQGWKGGYVWVRSMNTLHFVIPAIIQDLSCLTNLRNLTVDMSSSGLMLQRTYIEELFYSLQMAKITQGITSLTLETISRIDAHLLTFIGAEFTELVELNINSTEGINLDCCAGCYEESLSRIMHSPIPDVFCDATSLANTFGSALASLKKLSRLFLGVYLSPAHLLDLHICHGKEGDMDISPITIETIFDCSRCHRYRRITKQRELLGALVLARHLESIKNISWSSCFGMCTYNGRRLENENVAEGSGVFEWDVSYGKHSSENEAHEPKAGFQELRTNFIVDKSSTRIKITRIL